MNVSYNGATNETARYCCQVRILFWFDHGHISKLDVEVLIDGMQHPAQRAVVLQLEDDGGADERLEKGKEVLEKKGKKRKKERKKEDI